MKTIRSCLVVLSSAVILCSCANREKDQEDARERNARSQSRDPLDQLENALDREGDRWDRIEDKWDRRF